MDRALKCFFIFCFAVFFFAGCSPNEEKAQVRGSKSGAAKDQKVKNKLGASKGKETIDVAKLNPEQRKVTESVAKDVSVFLTMFKDADTVFMQAWGAIWKDNLSNPDNVFRMVRRSLESKYGQNGLPLLTASEPCHTHDYSLKQETTHKYKLIYTNCMNTKNPTVEEYATFEKIQVSGKESWRVEFFASNLRRYLGNSLSLLGVKAQCKVMQANSNGHLELMDCSDLGQNSGEMYLHLTQFKFDRTAKQPLLVSGTVYDAIQKPNYSFEMKDLPYDNTLLIEGQKIPREEDAAVAPAVNEQPALSAPPAAPSAVMPPPKANPPAALPDHNLVGTDQLAKQTKPSAGTPGAARPPGPRSQIPGMSGQADNGEMSEQGPEFDGQEVDADGNPLSPEENPAQHQQAPALPSQAVT